MVNFVYILYTYKMGHIPSKGMDLHLELLHATEALCFIDAACCTSLAKWDF
jgi:hypothetical protein